MSSSLSFQYFSGIFCLEAKQTLPVSLETCWEFFSNPQNLEKITPPHMGFQITSPRQAKMCQGQIITYKIGIFPGIKMNWVTEITNVIPRERFVDEQRFGPYRMWHHEHIFEKKAGSTLMTDRVHYRLPFSAFQKLVHPLLIKPQLQNIFIHREKKIKELFQNP